jgi:hypothetical protein
MPRSEPDEPVKERPAKVTRPIVRDYSIVSLAALGLMTLLLVEAQFSYWSIVPLLIGAIGIVAGWTAGPALVLLSMLVMLLIQRDILRAFVGVPQTSFLLPLLLAGATLVYLAGSTRLLSLVRHTVPPDSRRERRPRAKRVRSRWLLPRAATARSVGVIPAGEVGQLLLSVPLFLSAAYLIWLWLARMQPGDWYAGPWSLWPVVVLIWGGAIVLAGTWAFLAYLGRSQASVEENRLFLQDQLWAATRGEQRQINRVIARARLRGQRKEEGS